MSWPATSSITTWPGSLRPDSCSTMLDAGMPTMMTIQTMTVVTSHCQFGEMRKCARSHHNPSVTSDAHVPEPGRQKPIPTNVPTAHAHFVRCGRSSSWTMLSSGGSVGFVSGSWGIRASVRLVDRFRLVGIERWSAHHVCAAGPLPQVDQAAAFAAERELGVVAQDELLACRTSQAANCFSRHKSSSKFLVLLIPTPAVPPDHNRAPR